jgi:voltage-gated potassium channel
MKTVASRYEDLKALMKRCEGFVDTFQFLLSAIAVAMVVTDLFVPHTTVVPSLGITWADGQMWVRGFTWVVFIIDFIAFGLASGELFQYARKHWLELLVCLTWVPYYNPDLLKHVPQFLSADMLTVIGSVVHVNLVGRWTVRRFREHPMLVTVALAVVMVSTATPLLMKVEPQTFPTAGDAIWFCLQTIFTVGYGEIVPHTEAGRIVAGLLIINGVCVGYMFIALMIRVVQQRTGADDPMDKLHQKVDAQQKLIEELLAEVRRRPACGCDEHERGVHAAVTQAPNKSEGGDKGSE